MTKQGLVTLEVVGDFDGQTPRVTRVMSVETRGDFSVLSDPPVMTEGARALIYSDATGAAARMAARDGRIGSWVHRGVYSLALLANA
jgi:hypothetical protein